MATACYHAPCATSGVVIFTAGNVGARGRPATSRFPTRSSSRMDAHRQLCSKSRHRLLIANASRDEGSSVETSGTPSSTPPNLKIAVVGAGPCGLTTALALRHHGFSDVQVFDKFPEIKPALGAAFNLNGGVAVLDKLGLLEIFRETSNPMKVIRTRRVGGDAAGQLELMNIPIPELIRSDAIANETLISENDKNEMCGTVMRADLLLKLGEALPSESLKLGKKFEVVGAHKAGTRVNDLTGTTSPAATLQFADGTYSEPFDLVIGCDGVKSKVRAAMFGPYRPKNSGIRIIFGCTGDDSEGHPSAEDARNVMQHGELHQWFGDGCYTLVYTAGGVTHAKQHNVAVCIADNSELEENAEWLESTGIARSESNETAKTASDASNAETSKSNKARSAALSAITKYSMPDEVKAVAKECTRFFDVGVKYHDPLSNWSDELGVFTLAGDSCHAMPPFLGQGANQALQDSWVLAEQLSLIGDVHSTKKEALEKYESIRKPPTTQIMLSSRVIGFVETGNGIVGNVRDVAFGVLGKLGIAGKIFLKNAVPVLK